MSRIFPAPGAASPLRAALGTLALVLAAVMPASAQDFGAMAAQFRLERLPEDAVQVRPAAPGATLSIPGGWGAGWGLAFAGAGYQQRTRYSEDNDGAVVAGFGVGDPFGLIGLEAAFTTTSTVRSGFFERTTVSLKAHRAITNSLGLAVGYENALELGEQGDGGKSLYAALGKAFILGGPTELFSQITVNVGIGDGRFRSEEDVLADNDGVGVFGGVAVRVAEQFSVIGEWTGQDAAVGMSIVPIRGLPVTLSPALIDLTGSAGDGTRFILGIGYAARFGSGR